MIENNTKKRNILHQFLSDSAQDYPDRIAVEEPGKGEISYQDLSELSNRLRDRLHQLGVCPGDRVGIYMRKSIDAVASIFGILKTGAAYVPVDPNAPVSRNAYILNDCDVKVIIIEKRFEENFRTEFKKNDEKSFLIIARTGGGKGLKEALAGMEEKDPAQSETVVPSPDELAYILYTSGSTGKPKGVMLSHRNASSFIHWCSETFEPNGDVRLSSHAPFHFDLSILDLYLSIKHAGTLVLVEDDIGKSPGGLAKLISERRISIWYSTPSILSLLTQYGKIEQYDFSNLQTVLFAGEVFPVKHLRALKELVPGARYFNLYGPTETNVCTYYEIPGQIPNVRTEPYPIGKSCSHVETKVIDEQEREVEAGQRGELCVTGAGVMQGYWNLPENIARAFFQDEAGQRWYKTGDIVVENNDRDYIYVGRRDRMVKRRGYRIELGEIEAGLYRHPDVKDAAVIALPDEENGVRIKAILNCGNGNHPSIIALKSFCMENLPAYMVPDLFSFQDAIPKTSTDKVDYQKLLTISESK